MPDTMTVVSYYSVVVPNKTGEGARVLGALKEAGVNLTGFWGYPVKGRSAQLDLAPDDTAACRKALKKLGLDAGPKQTAFLISGDDHVGAVADALASLAAVGISVRAAQALCAGGGRFGVLIQVAPADEKKARKALTVK